MAIWHPPTNAIFLQKESKITLSRKLYYKSRAYNQNAHIASEKFSNICMLSRD